MNEKAIDYRFKILYAVAMLMVLGTHCQMGGMSLTFADWFIYGGVQLALFMFCSGYFYKESYEQNCFKYIKRKIKRLIVPLYIYNLFYGILVYLLRYKGFQIGGDFTVYNLLIAPINYGHQFIYNLGGWYIIPLFMVEVYNLLSRKLIKHISKNTNEYFFIVLGLIVGVIGNSLAAKGYSSNKWFLVLIRMFYFVPFYELGIFYKKCLEKYEKNISNTIYFSIIFFIKFIIIWTFGKNISFTPVWCNDFTYGPLMPIIEGCLGIALWLRVAALLQSIIGKNKIILLIADNTYSIMINQFLGFMFVKTIYGMLSKWITTFNSFDWIAYKTNIWYYYSPRNIMQDRILYLIAGIMIPVMIQWFINRVKAYLAHI